MNTNTCRRCNTENTNNARFCSGCGYELERPVNDTVEAAPSARKIQWIEKTYSINFGVIIGLAIAYSVQYFLFKAPTIDKAMMEIASELNKSCPIMVDAETRLDNSAAMPSNTLQYNYTFVNWVKDSLDLPELKKYLEPNIFNNAKTNPQMKGLRDNNVTLNYYYKDKEGVYLFEITVKPSDYK